MDTTRLAEIMRTPNAIKYFWDTLDSDIRSHMVKQLFQSDDLVDKRSHQHPYDEILAQKLNFRPNAIKKKSLGWRVERFLSIGDAQTRMMHDVCRRYLTIIQAPRFLHIQSLANGDEPEPRDGQYPAEWYLRIVDYLLHDVPEPLPCMLIFAMFADCPGRNEALQDARYQSLWERQCQWASTRTSLPPAERTIPAVLHVALPEEEPPAKAPVVRPTPVKPTPAEKSPAKPAIERVVVLAPPPPVAEVPPSFSPLQYVVNRAVEDSCAHIKGALLPDQMRDALYELLRLNSDTAHYYYHLGYYYGLSEAKFTPEKQQTQLAQAWAFLGYVLGCYRAQGDGVADVIGRNPTLWHLVLTQVPVNDLLVVYRLIPALIAHKSFGDIADVMMHCPIPDLKYAEHPDSVTMQIYNVAADLVRSGAQLPHADRILQELIAQLSAAGLAGNVYGRCLRKRGQFFRRKKQFNQASELFHAAIAVPGFSEIAQTHADIGMAKAGYAGLDALLPHDASDFRIVTQALKQHRQHFDDAVACDDGDDTNAQFALGLLDFGNGDYPSALERFRLAQIGMERQISAYRVRDLYDWLLFLKIRTWSQQLELSEIPLFKDELTFVFTSQTFFPLKHWLQIFRDVNKVHPETGRAIMLHLFTYRDVDIYDLCSIEEVFKHTEEIWRRYFFGSAKYNALDRTDKFAHLTQAWQVVLLMQNVDATDFVLELLERHGTNFSDYAAPVHKLIIEHREEIMRIWDETDVLFLRVQLLFMQGHSEEAISLLVQLCNIYFGRQELSEARAIYDWLAQLNYASIADYAHIIRAPRPQTAGRVQCKVLYIGGNETQQSFKEYIDSKLADNFPHIHVEWELIGWSSNWGDEAARIERRIPAFDLVILSPYVRTLFGRQIRRAASHWRASTGKGQGKIYADIVAAVESFQAN